MSPRSEFEQKINAEMPNIRKALVIFAIEKALLDFNKSTFDLVTKRLEKKHHCHISDCYENPIYLQNVLQELFGNPSKTIIKTIGENLREFSDHQQIGKFLDIIDA